MECRRLACFTNIFEADRLGGGLFSYWETAKRRHISALKKINLF